MARQSKKANLTVIVLTYNSSKTIRECLDSLCSQTFKNFNVLIVDDNSTDDTLELVSEYSKSKKLNIKVLKNGSHNIPKGRNIGLRNVKHGIAAFLDSDDSAQSNWLEIIASTFKKNPKLAMVSGEQVFDYSTYFSKAVGYNDDTMRKLFIRGILLFCTCNCAINRDVVGDYYFDENFRNGEDLEFGARVAKNFNWKYLNQLKVNHKTRATPKAYAKQMYLYGMWKVYYFYWTSTFRIVDFIPVCYGAFCLALGLLNPFLILAIFLFPLAQVGVSVLKSKASIVDTPTMFAAWCIKNTAWSIGVLYGMIFMVLVPILSKQFTQRASD